MLVTSLPLAWPLCVCWSRASEKAQLPTVQFPIFLDVGQMVSDPWARWSSALTSGFACSKDETSLTATETVIQLWRVEES